MIGVKTIENGYLSINDDQYIEMARKTYKIVPKLLFTTIHEIHIKYSLLCKANILLECGSVIFE